MSLKNKLKLTIGARRNLGNSPDSVNSLSKHDVTGLSINTSSNHLLSQPSGGFCYQKMSPSLIRLSKISKSPKRFKLRPEMLIKEAAHLSDEKLQVESDKVML